MTDKVELIKAEIKRIMAEEMSFFVEQCNGEGASSSPNAIVYTRMQMLLSFIDHLPEELVSEELEDAATKYAQDKYMPVQTSQAFKAGAQWQHNQLEKNRIKACDRATKEEIEREQDFCDKIIIDEHRCPTFSDAIEYGIEWQKNQGVTKEAVIGMATEEFSINVSQHTLDVLDLYPGDKVIIQIRNKED